MSEPQARTGWFKSPSGVYGHADGPAQIRAYTGQGWKPTTEDEALSAIAKGVTLTAPADAAGTFDADAVAKAVEEEAHAARSAAAKKAAETRAANRAAAQQAAEGSPAVATAESGQAPTVDTTDLDGA